jgi:2'-hydroxyisoflavone reductase
VLNRGRTVRPELAGVEQLRGDRDGDLSALAGRSWDAVVDTSGFFPRQLARTCAVLEGAVAQYAFFSTAAVYRTDCDPPLTERCPLRELASEAPELAADYGALKAAAERELAQRLPFAPLILRPGLVVGPGDHTDRFTYWPRRVSAGGDVLAPGPPTRVVQWVDVRDVAAWTLEMLEQRQAGTFNVSGPAIALGDLLDACRAVAGSDARVVWVDEDFLVAEGVRPWTELPLWMRGPASISVTSLDSSAALAAGLSPRPLEQTIRDTLAWDAGRPRPLPRGRVGTKYVVETLEPDRETALLRSWRARTV